MLVGLVIALFPSCAFADQPLAANVSATPAGQTMPPGFVGLSLEYKALHMYTGRDPYAINPVFLQLVRNLVPAGNAPILRIGGDSADATWWPIRGMIPPGGISYALTEGWLRMTHLLAQDLGAQLILGVNLAAGRPSIAAAEARAFLQGIGRRSIEALEIGNEPDLYTAFPWYRDRYGHIWYARSSGYDYQEFLREFSRWRAALPNVPIAGPAYAELTWLSGLAQLIRDEPGMRVLTIHRYPLHGCGDTDSPTYASVGNMLSDSASAGLAADLVPYVTAVHNAGLRFRIDELNSAATASCIGRPSAADTFSSALWALDTLFNLASIGVDGVNFHTLPQAAYELFTFTQRGKTWHGFVHPDYYGMLMFTQAFPPGAQLLPTTVTQGGSPISSTPVKVWATRAADGTIRVTLINKDPGSAHVVDLTLPQIGSTATLESLQAPSVSSTSGVTLGGQTFGTSTTTGRLGAPQLTTITPVLGTYQVTIPAGSAELLTQ